VNNLLLIGGVMACGAVLMLALLIFALFRIVRGSRQAPAQPQAYTPAPVAPARPVQPIQQPSAPALPSTAPWGQLRVVGGPAQPRAYALAGSGALIGRGDDCAVMVVGDGTISRRHAWIRNDGRQILVEDAGSTHGTYVSGLRVGAAVPLRRGDFIQVGQTLLRFE
jgi:pSer/pThr/pTyr-binding forkhead associated (FHA) protein